jgi:hypothetical protein
MALRQLLPLILLGCFVGDAFAQSRVVIVRRRNWSSYGSPATALSAQIHAQADFVRSYGQASVDLAAARAIRAQAVRMEIANSVEFVKAYWERRSIGEAERMKRYVAPLKRKELRDSKTWQRLKDHPELNGPAVAEGTALNFLLDRMAGGVLAYRFSLGNQEINAETLKQLELTPAMIHSLRLRQDLTVNRGSVFRADEGVPLDIDWWPYALRDEELTRERERYERARRGVLSAGQGQDADAAQKDLAKAYDDLVAKFQAQSTRSVRLDSIQSHHHYLTAKRFLQSLAGEVLRFQELGPERLQDDDLKFQGTNLVALLTHMSRNGLEFAAAEPGDEPAYHAVFRMMRDLYVTVAEDEKS